MTTLVTGGAGFIGSHFIERLLAREPQTSIVCLDDFNDFYDPARKRANVKSLEADPRVAIIEHSFCDKPFVEQLLAEKRIRRIVHLGAYAGVRSSVSDFAKYKETNIHGTAVLLEAAAAHPIARFVFVSSSTVYGRGAAAPFQEDAPLGTPLSPYGTTKRAGELLAMGFFRSHQLPVVCLRPFSVYGPRIRPDLAMWVFTDAIATGRPMPVYGDGTVRRDFTHVSDVCEGLIAALTKDNVGGEIINLGHHEPVAIRDLIGLLETALGRKAVIQWREPFAGDMPVTCADLAKAQRLLDYRPRISLAQGVDEFVAWYKTVAAT